MKKLSDQIIQRRLKWVALFFFIALAALVSRLFLMTIVHHREYVDLAARQHGGTEELTSERGTIFVTDKEGKQIPLAINKNYKVLVASPDAIKDKGGYVQALADYFHLDLADLEKKLSKEHDTHEVLARRIDPDAAAGLDLKKFPGISFEDENRRVYPSGPLASQVLGFVGVENDAEQGRYGLERLYDGELVGTSGAFAGATDAGSFLVALGKRIVRPPKNGASITLTIDYNIQQKAEEVLP